MCVAAQRSLAASSNAAFFQFPTLIRRLLKNSSGLFYTFFLKNVASEKLNMEL
jgi:hypothetical protein